MRYWLSITVFITVSIVFATTLYVWRDSDDVEPTPSEIVSEIPDFSTYVDVNEKKQEYFDFLLPKVRAANQLQLERREFLLSLSPDHLSNDEQANLYALAKRYRVKPADLSAAELIEALKTKVDVVPASLVLAQSANESAWGTSRFARQGNNLFGLWCFSEGCGLKPQQRNEGAIHEVERFETVQDGVNKYVRTLNSHPAYAKLREIRTGLRKQNTPLKGTTLAEGLGSYSERGQAYIDEIQEMIEYNELEGYNQAYAK